MPQQFDATLKVLLEEYVADYLAALQARFGLRLGGTVQIVDADVSTVTARADKVYRVEGPPRTLLDLEPMTGPDVQLPQRLLKYSVLLSDRHKLQVRTVVLLLRRKADGSHLTGTLRYQFADEEDAYLTFRYYVWRVWQLPVESVLAGGLGLLPLAPLTDVSRKEMPRVIARMDERIQREATPTQAKKLWTATYVLLGLRYGRETVAHLIPGVERMKDSDTYQAILDEGRVEGRVEEAKKILLLQGRKQFGPPDAPTRAALEALNDAEYLEQLGERLLDVASWQELLATTRTRRSRKKLS